MAWYLNRALTNFRREVNARWPNRDKRSDGTIGDPDHQSRDSDHNPDRDGSVDAWDMDIDGVDVWACINAALAHDSIQYIIYNRKITSRSWGLGTWRHYSGDNPHDKHVHYNTRSSHENSNKPWFTNSNEGDDDVQLNDTVRLRTGGDVSYSGETTTVEGILTSTNYYVLQTRNSLHAELAALRTVVEQLAAAINGSGGSVDAAAILSGVDERLATLRAEMRDAVADLGEGGAAQVRAGQ